MKKHRRREPTSYAARVLRRAKDALAAGQLQAGQVYAVRVEHDEWCDLLAGKGPCNCNPIVSDPLRVPTPEDN